MPAPRSNIDFVIKISKFCNLRCSYCYEFDELANKHRMSLEELRFFFSQIAASAKEYGRDHINFIWHGGEPFLIPLDEYARIGEMQQQVFGAEIPVTNFVQTNLTVLTDRHVQFLKDKTFFQNGIGVSFDVYGDQRVDIQGRLRTKTVLANLQRLKDEQISFGAITVLARNTLPRILEIHAFYSELAINYRLLPFYKTAASTQAEDHALSFYEVTGAFKAIFDQWFVTDQVQRIDPLDEYLRYAIAALKGGDKWMHDPGDERVFMLDTNGALYGHADAYAAGCSYGNAFREGFDALLESPVRQNVLQQARDRVSRHCGSCPYYGYCPGHFVAEATSEQRRTLESDGCPVREVIAHMTHRLTQIPLSDAVRSRQEEDLAQLSPI
jgi:uncharacterized protein